MDFTNKVALVTGAAVGIGRATAILLAQNGAKLVLVDINGEKLEALKAELAEYGDKILTFICDVSDEQGVNKVVEGSLKAFGKIDILVNNAALWRSKSSFLNTPTEEWKKYIDINIMGTVYFTKAVLPSMLEHSWGRVINVASVAGVYGNANMAHYSATKGAVIAFTKALAKEVTDKGVLVNSVSPGSVSPSDNYDIDHTQESTLSFMGRTGSDRENANLICFLASDAASYISGQNIQIDGCRKKQ
ncbi:MAG: SDR family oxidoreductase [Clostridia bacterium]|nr:SDR family oxidoreductase [Clostridia bacterium]